MARKKVQQEEETLEQQTADEGAEEETADEAPGAGEGSEEPKEKTKPLPAPVIETVSVPKKELYRLVWAAVHGQGQFFRGHAGKNHLMRMLGATTMTEQDEIWAEVKATVNGPR